MPHHENCDLDETDFEKLESCVATWRKTRAAGPGCLLSAGIPSYSKNYIMGIAWWRKPKQIYWTLQDYLLLSLSHFLLTSWSVKLI